MINSKRLILNPYDITLNTWNKLAQVYQDKFMHLDLYNDTYDWFYEHLPQSVNKLLEVGCGPGNIARYLLNRDKTLRFHLTDGTPEMLKLALHNNPEASGSLLDARHLHTLAGPYAGIVVGFCLPYLSAADTEKLIRDSMALLEYGGLLYLSFIEGTDAQSGFQSGSTGDQTYVYYHDTSAIKQVAEQAGLTVKQVFYKTYSRATTTTETHSILIAEK